MFSWLPSAAALNFLMVVLSSDLSALFRAASALLTRTLLAEDLMLASLFSHLLL